MWTNHPLSIRKERVFFFWSFKAFNPSYRMLGFFALPDHVLVEVGLLLFGLVALYFGAEWLVNSAAKISLKFGISPLAVGLTVVAFGTSAPELFVSLGFAANGKPDMSIGNVVGSNICNIGLVLGISAFICAMSVKRSLLTRDVPALLIASLLFVFFIRDKNVSSFEGAFMFACILGYTVYRLISSMKKGAAADVDLDEVGSKEEALKSPNWKLILMVLAGIFVLYIGAEGLIKGGVGLAKRMSVPEAIIALTLIAFGTSVPELATSIVATLRKEGDLIIGNIIGSCLFNLLCVIGITALVQPLNISHIESMDLWVMLAFTILLIPIMASKSTISRWEGSILLMGYLFYATYLWVTRVAGTEAVAVVIGQ